jgi:hypothetical protein
VKSITEIPFIGQCKYPLTDSPPHMFCAEPTVAATDKEPYCAVHKKLCSDGPGKHVRSLEEMIYAIDDSVIRTVVKDEHTLRVDTQLKSEAA